MLGKNPGASVKMAVATVLKIARAPPFEVQVTFWKYPYVTWVPSDLGHEPVVRHPEPYFYRFEIRRKLYRWELTDGNQLIVFDSLDGVREYLYRFLDRNFPLGIPYKVDIARRIIDLEKLEARWSEDETVWYDEEYYARAILPSLRMAPRRDP
jgi:hypothetical protein